MTEAEAFKQFIPILGRISTPYERATIVMRVNERINAKDRTSLLGVTYRHIAALAWPSDPVRAKQFEDKLTAAVDAGEFVSLIRDGKHLQIEELAAWPDCPAIAADSPLAFWLGEPAPAQPATPAPLVTVGDGHAPLDKIVHSNKTRRNTLTPVIEQAQKQCIDPQDTAAVWAALLVLAEKKTAPLIGATEDGLQYLKNGAAASFTRNALRQRLVRKPPITAVMRR